MPTQISAVNPSNMKYLTGFAPPKPRFAHALRQDALKTTLGRFSLRYRLHKTVPRTVLPLHGLYRLGERSKSVFVRTRERRSKTKTVGHDREPTSSVKICAGKGKL